MIPAAVMENICAVFLRQLRTGLTLLIV